MLVLSRKPEEAVVIDDTIRVTIVEIRGNKVRLGFEAPDGVKILRQELWLENQAPEPTREPAAVTSH